MFKNETHNHPTEIEPFGRRGDLPGRRHPRPAVRPLLRVPGHAGHRRLRPHRPPQRDSEGASSPRKRLVTTAAHGYSSYGNQIGLATGEVTELYHPNYVAKRMEIGAVIGAVPENHVVREVP